MTLRQHNPGLQSSRFSTEWVARTLFGFLMVAIAISALVWGADYFAGLTVLVCLFAAREWHRLVRRPEMRDEAEQRPIHVQTIITALAVTLGVLLLLEGLALAAAGVLVAGAVAAFVLARLRQDNPLWHGFGVLYIGVPALALVALRALPSQGMYIIIGLFLIVWATDTGALVFGRLIGGAKLWPAVSPGKTWAGTIGGSLTAAVVYGLYVGLLGFSVFAAMVFGLVFSVIAHGGDLFESWIKRRFGTKDSGALIPGHGGVLDRMDSTFAAGVALAILVFAAGFNPLFGGHV